MLILLALVVTSLADKPLTIRELLEQPITKEAEQLTGQDLVDYINKRQTIFKAEYWPDALNFAKARTMASSFSEFNNDAEVKEVEDFKGELPASFDARKEWSDCPSIDYIRDQSACGSCWAVSTAAAIGDRACIQSKGRMKVHASDTDLVACCHYCGFGCSGGMTLLVFKDIIKNGIVTGGRYGEKGVCMPYVFYPCGRHGNQTYYGECPPSNWPTPKCRKTCQRRYKKKYQHDKIYGKTAYKVPMNETSIRKEIMTNGPVVAAMTLWEDFVHYKGGIYVHQAGRHAGTHAVKVMGWGTEGGTDYWLVANSWNTDWGEDGYFRIVRGTNHCGIEEEIVAGMIDVER